MWCLILHPKGTTRNATIPADHTEVLDTATACTLLRRATAPELICTWTWISGAQTTLVYLFGYKTGKAGTEMAQKLPAPHDNLTLFGETLLCATQNNLLVSFDGAMFKTFCAEMSRADEEEEEEIDEADETDEEEEEEIAEEEEEEDAIPEDVDDVDDDEVVPKIIAKFAKPKKGVKRIPAWYALEELQPESYDIVGNAASENVRMQTLNVIKGFCGTLAPSEQKDLEQGIYNATLEDARLAIFAGYGKILNSNSYTILLRVAPLAIWTPIRI